MIGRLDGLDENERCRECYAYYGLAMYEAQVLEHGLVNLLSAVRFTKSPPITDSDIDDLFDEKFQNTMGKLVKEVRETVAVTEEQEQKLNSALKLRNYLAHHFWRERVEMMVTILGQERLIADLDRAVCFLREVDREFEVIASNFFVKNGITPEVIEREYEQMIKEARNKGTYPENFGNWPLK